eukprot:344994-Chlamydomonas_euryale.AAC.2
MPSPTTPTPWVPLTPRSRRPVVAHEPSCRAAVVGHGGGGHWSYMNCVLASGATALGVDCTRTCSCLVSWLVHHACWLEGMQNGLLRGLRMFSLRFGNTPAPIS